MKCTNCGSDIGKGQAFCSKCGTPVSEMKATAEAQPQGGLFNNEPPKKKGGVPVWVFLITILLIVGILVSVYFFVLKDLDWSDKDDDESSTKSSSRSKDDDEDEDEDEDEEEDEDEDKNKNKSKNNTSKNNTSSNNSSSNNSISNNKTNSTGTGTSSSGSKVTVGSYQVQVPSDMQYKVSGNDLELSDSSGNKWMAKAQFNGIAYATAVQGKETLKSTFTSGGMNISDAQETTIGGVQCILYEGTYQGESIAVIVANVNTTDSALILTYSEDTSISVKDVAKKVVPIIANAEKTGTTSNMSTEDLSIDLTGLK